MQRMKIFPLLFLAPVLLLVSASQYVSLQPGQSLLLSRLPDDDTQQVVIITPQIDRSSLPL